MNQRQFFLIALVALVLSSGGMTSCSRSENAENASRSSNHLENDPHRLLLKALVIPNVDSTNSLSEQMKLRRIAIDELRKMGTNVLPRLMIDVRRAGGIEATNRSAAATLTREVAAAFEVLGSEANPLTSQLIDELQFGRSIVPSINGLMHIGGTEAGLGIVSALTNEEPYIHYNAASGLTLFANNREVSDAAAEPLLKLLHADSPSMRAGAASTLGALRSKPELVLPELMSIAEQDLDLVVRSAALNAIGRFGTNASFLESRIEIIASGDQDFKMRQAAKKALDSVLGRDG